MSVRLPLGVRPPAGLGGELRPDGVLDFATDSLTAALHQLTGWAIDHHVTLEDLRIVRPSLEDIYLQLTQSPAGDASQHEPPRTVDPMTERFS